MFRVLEFAAEGVARELEGADAVGPPNPGCWRWIDCHDPTADDLRQLGERFGFHPVALEDCGTYDHRPKVQTYDDHLFVVIHALVPDPNDETTVDARELHAFVSSSYLVTVSAFDIPQMNAQWLRLRAEPAMAHRGPVFAYYLVADSIVSAVFPWIEDILETIESVEDAVLESPGPHVLTRAYALRRLLVTLRRMVAPQRDVFAALSKADVTLIGKKLQPFIRGLHEDLIRLTELVESAREQVTNLREAYVSAVSNHTNEVMKRLTVLSAVFLPLTFLTGFFGQNFEALPFKSPWLLWLVLGCCAATPPAMIFWLRSRNWL